MNSPNALTLTFLSKAKNPQALNLKLLEPLGLIPSPERLTSGYRSFPESTLDHPSFIKRSKELDFSQDEIAPLLRLDMSPEIGAETVKGRRDDKIAVVERKIDLQRSGQPVRLPYP